MRILTALLTVSLLLGTATAEAKRLGGGKSIGRQSTNVTQREATSPAAAPQAPMQNSAAGAAAAPTKAAQPTPSPAAAATPAPVKRPWGAMLGGLAAGLGLAWLAHSLGLGAAFGNFLLVALLAVVVIGVIGMFMRRRPAAPGGFAFQGAGGPSGALPSEPIPLRQYKPEHVGNDASARPWERSSMAFTAQPEALEPKGVVIGSALSGPQGWGVPSNFDTPGFLAAAKRNFVTLQDAWDRADIPTLRSMMTDGMVGEIRTQLSERESHTAGMPNKTDVVMIDAHLLGIEDLGEDYMASVEFSGMIREQPSAGPSPFREVWNMTKPKDGRSGWLVAGVQALQ